MLEQLELTVGALGQDRGAERLHDLLDGDILVGKLVSCGADEPESAHANRLEIRIPRGDLEGSPEDLGSDEFSHCELWWSNGRREECRSMLVESRCSGRVGGVMRDVVSDAL